MGSTASGDPVAGPLENLIAHVSGKIQALDANPSVANPDYWSGARAAYVDVYWQIGQLIEQREDFERRKAEAREHAINLLVEHGHTRESAEKSFDELVDKMNAWPHKDEDQ